jgi:hypothetical protein
MVSRYAEGRGRGKGLFERAVMSSVIFPRYAPPVSIKHLSGWLSGLDASGRG